jgi:hypothetical protein
VGTPESLSCFLELVKNPGRGVSHRDHQPTGSLTAKDTLRGPVD